jgi:hypothetical protein
MSYLDMVRGGVNGGSALAPELLDGASAPAGRPFGSCLIRAERAAPLAVLKADVQDAIILC